MWTNFTFNFSCNFVIRIFFSLKQKLHKRQSCTAVMDQNLRQYDSSKSNGNGEVPKRETNHAEKSNKCNQCDFVSSFASALRRHLKTHIGEKSNKCSQCDYASSHTGTLGRHLKRHSGEKPNKCNQCDFVSS